MTTPNILNGGQVIVDYLVRERVPYVFGLCGHGNIGLLDALYERASDIKTISVHHEAVAEETPRPEEWNANISSRCGADPDGVKQAADMLLAAKRPVLLVGQGVRYGGAAAELKALAERLQIPVAASATGLGALPADHPLALGLVSRGGVYQANHAARQADVLLALGVRFDDRTPSSWLPGYSFTIPPTKLIHVDIDPEEIARNYPVALGLMADVRTFLRQLLAEIDARKDVSARADARKKWLATIDGYR